MNTSATKEKKSNFHFPRKQYMVPLDKELQWVNVKQKLNADLGTFRHNQAYPRIIHAYSSIFKTLFNPGIFRTVVYPAS